MKISEIAERILSHCTENMFLFCDEYTTGNADISAFLMRVYGIRHLQLSLSEMPVYSEILQISGMSTLEGAHESRIIIIFSPLEQGRVKMTFSVAMPAQWRMSLDNEQKYCLSSICKNYTLILGGNETNELTGSISGMMALEHVVFDAVGSFDSSEDNWSISLSLISHATLQDLARVVLNMLQLGALADILPASEIEKLYFRYQNASKENDDYMYLDISSAANLKITDSLGVESIGVSIEKYADSYEYSLKGGLLIGKTLLPLKIRYRDDGFLLAVDTGSGGTPLPSLADIGSLVGIGEFMFPQAILDMPCLMLRSLTATLPPQMEYVGGFNIAVSTTENWNFFEIGEFSLSDLYFGFSYTNATDKSTQYVISGKINISDLTIMLSAIYSSTDGWVFGGCFPYDSNLNLTALLKDLTKKMHMEMQDLPIPQILLENVLVEFALDKKTFSASATVGISGNINDESILNKLFNINAKVSITSEIIGNVRTFSGSFSGSLAIGLELIEVEYLFDTAKKSNQVTAEWSRTEGKGDLTLTEILREFGVTDIPPVVSTLDIGIHLINIVYDIEKSQLSIKVVSAKFGDVIAIVSDTNYDVEIHFKQDIKLSALPVVGNNLHLLDSLAIQDLQFIATSHDRANVKKGVALLGSVHNEPFLLQVYQPAVLDGTNKTSNDSAIDLTKWFSIEKSASIFAFHRLGVAFRDGRISFLLDASIASSQISLDLMGLGLGFNISNPSDIGFYLSGLGIDYSNDTLSIGGAFMKSSENGIESYDGRLLIKFKELSLFAIGSYSEDSLFVYAVINSQLGGPPAFFVTGIAVGFGYNMDVTTPEIDHVSQFPLVAGAMGTLSETDMLASMKKVIRPLKGQQFLSAGVKFTSFKMAESFALLTVTFGRRLEISVLGLSQISIPANINVRPLAYAQLALRAVYSPSQGLFSVMALLTSESYILSESCKLTGGFAFCLWLDDTNNNGKKGDFVITLGGYHSSYDKPSHYPIVPRVGFLWNVSREVTISGEMYFALTPSTLMAGGRLSVVYQSGSLKAWFVAQADFFISWKPFHYDIYVGISLGASYRVDWLFIHHTFKIELSADIHIWGPNFSGTVHISWFIISFTVKIGDNASQQAPPIDWHNFKHSFFPKGSVQNTNSQEVCPLSIAVSEGLRTEVKIPTTAGDKKTPVVFSDGLIVNIRSSIPSEHISVNDITVHDKPRVLGVLPMGENVQFKSSFSIKMRDSRNTPIKCDFELIQENVPSAMWSITKPNTELISDVVTGIKLYPVKEDFPVFPKNLYIDLEMLSICEKIQRDYQYSKAWTLTVLPSADPIGRFKATVVSAPVADKRKRFVESMRAQGFDLTGNISMDTLSSRAESLFSEEIRLGLLF